MWGWRLSPGPPRWVPCLRSKTSKYNQWHLNRPKRSALQTPAIRVIAGPSACLPLVSQSPPLTPPLPLWSCPGSHIGYTITCQVNEQTDNSASIDFARWGRSPLPPSYHSCQNTSQRKHEKMSRGSWRAVPEWNTCSSVRPFISLSTSFPWSTPVSTAMGHRHNDEYSNRSWALPMLS
jgi:hypothetical protein